MGTGEDGGRTVELISETKVRLHKVKKKWLRRVTRLVRKRKLARDLDDVRISSPSMVKGIVSIGALLSGVAIEQAVTEDVVYASEYTEETALAMTDEVTMNTVVSENAEPTSIDGEDSTEPVIEEVVEETVEESISEEETVPLARDNSRLEAIIASMKAALTELVDPGDQADSQAYKDYLEARTRLEEKLKLAEQLLQDNSRTQEELDKAALEYGQDAINLTRLAEEFRTYSASVGSGFRRLTNQEVITSGTVSLSIPSTVEPMGLSGGQLRATIQFSVNDLAKAGDQFTVTLSQNLNLSGSGVPADVKIPNIVVDGKVIATGVWNHDARTITYTLNSNVDDLQSVTGNINLSVFVDQKVVQSEGSQQFTITLNNQDQATQSSYIRYSDPVSRSDGAYSLRAYLTNINLTNGTYDHVIYLNENGRNNNNYNEILQIVSKGASSFSAATTTIRAYSVPQGQFIDSMEGDFSNYADASNRITSSFGTNGQSLRLNIGGYTNSPLIIVVSSRVDVNSTKNISTETTYANSAMNAGSQWTNTNYMFANAAIARGEYNSTSISLSTSESISTSISESTFESMSESISNSESESIAKSTSESSSESVRQSISESSSESVSSSISESISESVVESVSESVSES
ncbi:TPA: hypothetical protein U1148_001915, partial [Streptococcus suis]|nr:hypothetical protein [Streptococcus suis]